MQLKNVIIGLPCVLKRTGEVLQPIHRGGTHTLCRPRFRPYSNQCEVIMQYKYLQLKKLINSVTLEMDAVRPGMHDPRFTELALMLAAHESHAGLLRKQIGGGPARGLFGFEERSYLSTWQHSDTIAETSVALGITCDFDRVEEGDRHSIFMCRHLVAMDPAPLPEGPEACAQYAKDYWNSPKGKATPAKYLNDYNLLKEGRL